jgi:hypothetical protein
MAIDYYDKDGWRTRDFTMDAEDAAQAALHAGAHDVYGNELGTRTRAEAGFDRFGYKTPGYAQGEAAAVMKQKVAAQDAQEAAWAAVDATRRQNSLVPLDYTNPQALAKTQRTNLAQIPGGTDFYNQLMTPNAVDRKKVADYHQNVFDVTGSLGSGSELGPLPGSSVDVSGSVLSAGKKTAPSNNLNSDLLDDPRFKFIQLHHPERAEAIYQAVHGRSLKGDLEAKLALQTSQDAFNTQEGQKTFPNMIQDPKTGKLMKRVETKDLLGKTTFEYVEPSDYDLQNYKKNYARQTGFKTPEQAQAELEVDQQAHRQAERAEYLKSKGGAAPAVTGAPYIPGQSMFSPGSPLHTSNTAGVVSEASKIAHPTVATANAGTPADPWKGFREKGKQDMANLVAGSSALSAPARTIHNLGVAVTHGINNVAGAFGATTPPIPSAMGGDDDYVKSNDEMTNILGNDWYNMMPSWMGGGKDVAPVRHSVIPYGAWGSKF